MSLNRNEIIISLEELSNWEKFTFISWVIILIFFVIFWKIYRFVYLHIGIRNVISEFYVKQAFSKPHRGLVNASDNLSCANLVAEMFWVDVWELILQVWKCFVESLSNAYNTDYNRGQKLLGKLRPSLHFAPNSLFELLPILFGTCHALVPPPPIFNVGIVHGVFHAG